MESGNATADLIALGAPRPWGGSQQGRKVFWTNH